MGSPSFVEARLFRPPEPLLCYPGDICDDPSCEASVHTENVRIFGVTNVASVSVRRPKPDYVAVYLHGNAENLRTCAPYAKFLGEAMNAEVHVPEYSGYWCNSSGDAKVATEQNCFDDVEMFVGELVLGERKSGRNLPVSFSVCCAQ
jgi:hypothetical protein